MEKCSGWSLTVNIFRLVSSSKKTAPNIKLPHGNDESKNQDDWIQEHS